MGLANIREQQCSSIYIMWNKATTYFNFGIIFIEVKSIVRMYNQKHLMPWIQYGIYEIDNVIFLQFQ